MRTHRYGGAARVLAEAQAEQLRLECSTEVPYEPFRMSPATIFAGRWWVARLRAEQDARESEKSS